MDRYLKSAEQMVELSLRDPPVTIDSATQQNAALVEQAAAAAGALQEQAARLAEAVKVFRLA